MRSEMTFRDYGVVHPDWGVVHTFSPEETHAAIELFAFAMLVDGVVSDCEREFFLEQLGRLPAAGTHVTASTIKAVVESCEKLLATGDAGRLDQHLGSLCDRLVGEDHSYALLQMLAILSVCDGYDDAELEFVRSVGRMLGLRVGDVEAVLEAALSENQAGQRDTLPIPAVPVRPSATPETTAPYPNTIKYEANR